MNAPPFDLQAKARAVMVQQGFEPEFPAAIQAEADHLPASPVPDGATRDLRHLLWSSIDNPDSRDLDQIEFVEAGPVGALRLLVGVADVESYVRQASALDAHAAVNTVSVYTGARTFPMLPEQLSTNRTSLVEGQDRLAFIVEMVVEKSDEVHSSRLYQALVRNQARLDYPSVADWFEHRTTGLPAFERATGLEEQLRLQFEAGARLWEFRRAHGALTFSDREAVPIVRDGEVQELRVSAHNCARDVIESFMISANVTVAEYFREQRIPSIRRVVRTPKRWDRIRQIAARFGTRLPAQPEPRSLSAFLAERRLKDPAHFPELSLTILKLLGAGEYVVSLPEEPAGMHFGLAVHDYTHSTAPNRRYPDLLLQRLLKTPGVYSINQLAELAGHCTERARAARKVERLMRKIAAAVLLRGRIGELFEGLITGVKPNGTFVRLTHFPAEGKVVRGEAGLDVGDKVQVRLLSIDPERGFIDFETCENGNKLL